MNGISKRKSSVQIDMLLPNKEYAKKRIRLERPTLSTDTNLNSNKTSSREWKSKNSIRERQSKINNKSQQVVEKRETRSQKAQKNLEKPSLALELSEKSVLKQSMHNDVHSNTKTSNQLNNETCGRFHETHSNDNVCRVLRSKRRNKEVVESIAVDKPVHQQPSMAFEKKPSKRRYKHAHSKASTEKKMNSESIREKESKINNKSQQVVEKRETRSQKAQKNLEKPSLALELSKKSILKQSMHNDVHSNTKTSNQLNNERFKSSSRNSSTAGRSHETHSNDNVCRVLRPKRTDKEVVESIAVDKPVHQQPSMALKKREVIQMYSCINVQIGDIVLVKWASYPYWPAVVENVSKGSAQVMFFGDSRRTANVKLQQLFDFAKNDAYIKNILRSRQWKFIYRKGIMEVEISLKIPNELSIFNSI